MKLNKTQCWASFGIGLAVAVAGCGGGGSVNDGTVPLQLSPEKVEIRSEACMGPVRGPEVMVTGGVPPFTIHNPYPNHIRLSETALRESGESFRIDILGGACLTKVPVQVTDADANTVSFVIDFIEP